MDGASARPACAEERREPEYPVGNIARRWRRKVEEHETMKVILGIDGGGTNTRAAIVADGKVVGSGQSGSIKRLRVGAEAAEANLRAVLKEIFAQAGVKGVQ